MSQNDFTIANQGFPAFRADLNSALQALASNNSGATEPSTMFANMWWYDSANDIMYIRNEDNDAWIKFAELDQTNDKFVLSGTLQLDDGTVSAPALTFNSDTNMGIYRGGTDILKFVTAGTDRLTIDASGVIFSEVNGAVRNLDLNNEADTPYMTFSESGAVNFFIGESSIVGGGGVGFYDLYATSGLGQRFFTNSLERMRIDSSGRVGIGQSSPDSESLVDLGSGENSGYTRKLLVTNTGNSRAGLGALSNIFRVFYADDQAVQFGTVSRDGAFTFAEKMRIDSGGHLLLNTTTERNAGNLSIDYAGSSQGGIGINDTSSSNASPFIGFLTGGTFRGSITNNNNTAVAYNTTSDHRLKENVTADWDATTRLKQLNPVRFNFIADADRTVDGFLAHEVQSVVPEAITGTHNEVDADGNPIYQGIDQSKLVPLLVKTIQELEARITALENGV